MYMEQDEDTRGKKAIIYTRVSYEEQTNGASPQNQLATTKDYAKKRGMIVPDEAIFYDDGYSAKSANRPNLKKMLNFIMQHKGEYDYLVVYDVSRISRDVPSFYQKIYPVLKSYGIKLRSTKEPIGEDPTGVWALTAFLSTHQLDNELKGKTSHDNMSYVAHRGYWVGQAPIGFVAKKVYTDEVSRDGRRKQRTILEPDNRNDLADKLAMLLNDFSRGDMRQVDFLNRANDLGITNTKGNPLTPDDAKRILTGIVYAGYNNSKSFVKKDEPPIKLKNEGIISLETYQTNQILLKNGGKPIVRTKENEGKYPLRKKFLICEECGDRYMTGSAPRNHQNKSYPRYHCKGRGHGSVDVDEMHSIFNDFLEQITPKESTLKLFREIIKRTAKEKYGSNTRALNELTTKINKISDDIYRAQQLFIEQRMSEEDKDEYINRQKQERDRLKEQRSELENIQQLDEATINYVCNFMAKPAKLWRDADFNTKLALQRMMFPNGLHFSIREKKCRTQDLSPLFSVICNKKASDDADLSEMVRPIGLEPTTPSSGSWCSNPLSYGRILC